MAKFFLLLLNFVALFIPGIVYFSITPCLYQRESIIEPFISILLSIATFFWLKERFTLKRTILAFLIILLGLGALKSLVNSCYFPDSLLLPKPKMVKIKGEFRLIFVPPPEPLWCFGE
jgi:hypothetical protein